MTITLNPNQESAVRAAIGAGRINSVEDLIDQALAGLLDQDDAGARHSAGTIAEQGLGLFGGPEDAALLDEVVSLAYSERRKPSRREPAP